MKSNLEEETRRLIAYKLLTSSTGSLSRRFDWRYKDVASEIGRKLKEKKSLPEDSSLYLNLKWSDRAIDKSRGTALALDELKKNYPEAYNLFEEILKKHKKTRRAEIEFGGEVGDEIYVEVIKSTFGGKVTDAAAMKMYGCILSLEKRLGRKKKDFETYLLPE